MSFNLDKIIPMSCNGNKDAEAYLRLIAYSARVIDDLVDRDVPVSNEQICKAFFSLTCSLYQNAFFKKHFNQLTATWTVAFNAWMDSNAWSKGSELEKTYAHVLRDYVNELCPLVAFLTGDYEAMRDVSLKIRTSFIKEVS